MKKVLIGLVFAWGTLAVGQSCSPVGGVTCTPNLDLWNLPQGYINWQVPLNSNWSILDTQSALYPQLSASNIFTQTQTMPNLFLTGTGCVSGSYAKADGTGCGPGGIVNVSGTTTVGNLVAFSAPTVITNATPAAIASLLSTLSGCSSPNNLYSPANGNCIGGGTGQSVGNQGQVQMVGATTGSFAASSATDNGTTFNVGEPLTDAIVNGVSYSAKYPGFTLD